MHYSLLLCPSKFGNSPIPTFRKTPDRPTYIGETCASFDLFDHTFSLWHVVGLLRSEEGIPESYLWQGSLPDRFFVSASKFTVVFGPFPLDCRNEKEQQFIWIRGLPELFITLHKDIILIHISASISAWPVFILNYTSI